jgi:N-acetylneuraminic acid mutarotase
MSAWTGEYPRETNAPNVYVYDPDANNWNEKAAMPENRRRGAAAVVVSDDGEKIYVSHGNNGGHERDGDDVDAVALGYLDEYDINTNTWKVISSNAPNPRDHTCGAMIGGRLCVAAGRDGGLVSWPEVAATDCYNFATGLWEVEASIPQKRAGSSCGTTCDGKLMVAGGEGGGRAWDNVDVFDGKSWTSIANLQRGRHGSGLAVDCVCNQIHVASGAADQGGGPEIRSIETWFPGGANVPCNG